ncbi:hypothetical protein OHA72_46355 [Dactylosporangium sp. NBC_01737]|uniref:hypothetical protein n=1 Tax=Dactylosporangium sp. NBC_01737 TaxID=2975959 RepID=UPI002E140041|nr:hypothetical protein OHA72_46355 [Dactylosporangium sp. NBC_01737]
MAAIGVAIAAVAGLAAVSLIWPQTAMLLPIARFLGLVWLAVAGYRLSQGHATPPMSVTDRHEGARRCFKARQLSWPPRSGPPGSGFRRT